MHAGGMSWRWLLGPAMALLATVLACEPQPEGPADPLAARLLQPSYSGHRARALRELEELDEASRRAYVPTLIAALDDRNHYVRLNAALTLGRIGDVAAEALPRLRRAATEDRDSDVRRMAGEALAIQGIDTERPQ
jgi:HEAT repeat protein